MRARTLPGAVAVALTLAAAVWGCGSDDEDGATSAPTTTTSTAAEPTGTTETPGEPSKPSSAEQAPPEPEPQELTSFSTPSGNIGCVMDPEYVRCDIRNRSWEPPAPPADCELDYGHGVELGGDSRAALICAGDTTLGAEQVLEYGETSRVGPFRCISAAAGMTCQADGGHGFFLSKETYELY